MCLKNGFNHERTNLSQSDFAVKISASFYSLGKGELSLSVL